MREHLHGMHRAVAYLSALGHSCCVLHAVQAPSTHPLPLSVMTCRNCQCHVSRDQPPQSRNGPPAGVHGGTARASSPSVHHHRPCTPWDGGPQYAPPRSPPWVHRGWLASVGAGGGCGVAGDDRSRPCGSQRSSPATVRAEAASVLPCCTARTAAGHTAHHHTRQTAAVNDPHRKRPTTRAQGGRDGSISGRIDIPSDRYPV